MLEALCGGSPFRNAIGRECGGIGACTSRGEGHEIDREARCAGRNCSPPAREKSGEPVTLVNFEGDSLGRRAVAHSGTGARSNRCRTANSPGLTLKSTY